MAEWRSIMAEPLYGAGVAGYLILYESAHAGVAASMSGLERPAWHLTRAALARMANLLSRPAARPTGSSSALHGIHGDDRFGTAARRSPFVGADAQLRITASSIDERGREVSPSEDAERIGRFILRSCAPY